MKLAIKYGLSCIKMNSSFQSCYVHLMELTSNYFRSTSVYTNIHSNQFYSSSICVRYTTGNVSDIPQHLAHIVSTLDKGKYIWFDLQTLSLQSGCPVHRVQCTLWTLQLAISHSTDITRQYYGFSMRIFHNGLLLKTACARGRVCNFCKNPYNQKMYEILLFNHD